MISIRLATAKDRPGTDKITKEFGNHEYSHSPKYFDKAILTNNIFVAIDNDEIIGYLIYHVIWGNTPFIELLRVTSKYQREGIGSKLLLEFEKKMKEDEYDEIVSSSERVNEVGNAFHKKHEFKIIGELDMIYGKETFYLKKLS
ncbi:MAG: GNAT family N-acetyltransferase [Candidatus Levyibacteriota bacterium]